MIPHLLHTTGRAVAVVQNQTHTIRNVLQLQSSGPSSGSGSSWGNGPGPGGSKYGTGSRFYAGYNSAGRAVTQANAVTSHDGQLSQTDDNEDLIPKRHVVIPSASTAAPKPRRPRIRSSSVSLSSAGAVERAEHIGVLKTVQLHARGKHTFAPAPVETKETPLPAEPLLVRRNSTSAPLSPLLDASDLAVPPSPLDLARPATPQRPEYENIIERLKGLGSPVSKPWAVEGLSRQILKLDNVPISAYNSILSAIIQARETGEPLVQVVQFYNAMLDKSVVPDIETYELLIHAFVDRDRVVSDAAATLDARQKRFALGALDSSDNQNFLKQLSEERNFDTALKLFDGVLAMGKKDNLHPATYSGLLMSASIHADVNAALHVFAQLEARSDIKPSHQVYRYLLTAYSKAGLHDQAIEIFEAYVEAAKELRIHDAAGKFEATRLQQIKVWNAAIDSCFLAGRPEKGVELVEQIMQTTNDHFSAADPPVATPSAFISVIKGFINTGDIDSAVSWFDRLLAVQHSPPADPFQGLGGHVMRPGAVLWSLMIDALASADRTTDLVRIWKVLQDKCAAEDNINLPYLSRRVFHVAVVNNYQTLQPAEAVEALLLVLRDMDNEQLLNSRVNDQTKFRLLRRVCNELIGLGVYEHPIDVMHRAVSAVDPTLFHRDQIRIFLESATESAAKNPASMDITSALTLVRIAKRVGFSFKAEFVPVFVDAYGRSRAVLHFDELAQEDWNALFAYAAEYETAHAQPEPSIVVAPNFSGLNGMLRDLADQGLGINHLDLEVVHAVLSALTLRYGKEHTAQLMEQLGTTFELALQHYDEIQAAALQNSLVSEAQPDTGFLPSEEPANYNGGRVKVDSFLSRNITTALAMRPAVDPAQPYNMFEQGLTQGLLPDITTLSNLIQAVGRANMLDRVRELYTAAQAVLHLKPAEKHMADWSQVENSMIIALAHAGHPEAAHMHRLRILEQGFAPSADAYSILIQLVKDTTDDTSGALDLFKEALDHGVHPNVYLYNNVISKLAKARKADQALELFHQMKIMRLRPTAITYGAIIAACARVGDTASAENLFKDMVRMEGFKPRVPPYNTMMQLFAQTKPQRSSVLYYYGQMQKAGVQPTAHTYKLLMDAYGTIEPIQLDKMEETFEQLKADPECQLTGAHFASLINAYGYFAKNLEKAVSIFEGLLSGQYPGAPSPDAVVFEAMINVVVAHKRTELIPVYVNKMTEQGVHMTAYIANFLIKGYALSGDIAQARSIFESLSDPPAGVAAPNNHAPHSPDLSSESEVSVMEPVYREPSTWESMVRAELGAGNPDAAKALLERIRERGYPEAVYSRISGIMVDNSVFYYH